MRDQHLLADAAPPTAAEEAAGQAPFDRALAALRDLRTPAATVGGGGGGVGGGGGGGVGGTGKGDAGASLDGASPAPTNGGGSGGGAVLRLLRLARGPAQGPAPRLSVGLADERDELLLLGAAHRCLNR